MEALRHIGDILRLGKGVRCIVYDLLIKNTVYELV